MTKLSELGLTPEKWGGDTLYNENKKKSTK